MGGKIDIEYLTGLCYTFSYNSHLQNLIRNTFLNYQLYGKGFHLEETLPMSALSILFYGVGALP